MKTKIHFFCFLVALFPTFSACQKEPNYETVIYNDGKEETVKNPTIEALTKNGAEVSILPDAWMSFYKDREDASNICRYYQEGLEETDPKSLTLRWVNAKATNKYTLLLADNKQLNNPVAYDISSTYQELTDLYAGTHYYYRIKAYYDDRTVISRLFDFKTYDFFRTIKIDGVLNARDLGNKLTENGKKRVKQGLIYRTANFDSVNSRGKIQAIEQYGIKTDLDLREQGPTESPLGPEVRYINNGVGTYGSPFYVSTDTGVNVPQYQVAMRDNLKVFVDANNYPLAFHCAVGRDRTGTLAITLLLLLGVKEDQVKQDYVVSFFSKACNSVNFDSYESSMDSLFRYCSNYNDGGVSNKATIYERVERYCLHVGLSKDDISSIRNNLLEDI